MFVHCVIRTKLEIWGRAQREAAQRPQSDFVDKFWGVEISMVTMSHGPNAIALGYTAHAVLILGGSHAHL